MKKFYVFIFFYILFYNLAISSFDINLSKSKNYDRITDCLLRDIDFDGIDEIIISSYNSIDNSKVIDVYKIINNNLAIINSIPVPYYTVFFDIGDVNNDGKYEVVFLTSEGLYYKDISNPISEFTIIPQVKSEIVVPQPELLKDVNMVIDLDGNHINELVVENIRAIEIYETKSFKKIASINLETVLEYALIPGQFYPHLIFYTLPIILIKDLDNDGKKEIITKFPTSINIYAQKSLSNW
jgi:hypothetical protein